MGDYDIATHPSRAILASLLRASFYGSRELFTNCGLTPNLAVNASPQEEKDENQRRNYIWGHKQLCKLHLQSRFSGFSYSYPADLVTFTEMKKTDGTCKEYTLDIWIRSAITGLLREALPFASKGFIWPTSLGDAVYTSICFFNNAWGALIYDFDVLVATGQNLARYLF